jgi:hypothetical protein
MSASNISCRVEAAGASGCWNPKVLPAPVQRFLYRYYFFHLLHTFNIACAFVLTSPSKDGDLSVKHVVKSMFMDKLRVCVCINDYDSVEFTI